MNHASSYRRNIAALGLVVSAVLSAVSVALQPQLGDTPQARLDAIAAAGPSAIASAVAFVVSQLPLMVGLLGVAHLLRPTTPNLGTTAATIGVAGAFGHTVAGSVLLTQPLMAADVTHREAFSDFIGQLDESPIMMFSLIGLIGTVVGFLLLGIALWRSRLVPRWIPVLLWLFLAVEFVGTAVIPKASYLSIVCVLIVFGAMALAVWRSPRASWAFSPAAYPVGEAATTAPR